MTVTYDWRGAFDNVELNELHAEAFETRVFDETERNWVDQVHRHSLGWVVARDGNRLIGFVNVFGMAWFTPGCRTRWSPSRHVTQASARPS
jgi:hypothetical protein